MAELTSVKADYEVSHFIAKYISFSFNNGELKSLAPDVTLN